MTGPPRFDAQDNTTGSQPLHRPEERCTYDGWANCETWLVNLWISNDASSYEYWKERTCELAARRDEDDNAHAPIVALAGELCDAIHEQREIEQKSLTANLTADLLNAALAEVDWYELAKSFIEDFAPPAKEPEKSEKPERLVSLGSIVATPPFPSGGPSVNNVGTS